jgi:MFS family permease
VHVVARVRFSILSFYLPLTIYLQSVLGLSAVDAGLTIAAQPLTMIVLSGVSNGLMAKVSAKYLLIPGLVTLGAGTGFIAFAVHANSGRWSFLPGLILAGAGMAFIWGPVYALATRDLRPEHGGVASGVLNTIQEFGAVTAGAVVGAVLQTQLASNLRSQAVAQGVALPEQARAPFVRPPPCKAGARPLSPTLTAVEPNPCTLRGLPPLLLRTSAHAQPLLRPRRDRRAHPSEGDLSADQAGREGGPGGSQWHGQDHPAALHRR